jgi:hypothetical protein
MDLETFVSQSLLEISTGLRRANEQIKSNSGIKDLPATYLLKPGSNADIGRGIQFDVAVTTSLEGKGSAGAGLKLSVVEVTLGGGAAASSEQVSRIKFTVAVNQDVG